MVIPSLSIVKQKVWGRIKGRLTAAAAPLARPSLSQLATWPAARLPCFVRECAVAMKYLHLLGELVWDNFQQRPPGRVYPGPKPEGRAPYVAAFLVKVDQEHKYMSQLRTYLVEHPALVWVLGFPLVPSDSYSWGFDVAASVPPPSRFSRVLRELHNESLQFLLDGTVRLLGAELPAAMRLGDEISLDTKHIIAWVRENNPKERIKDRYDKTKQPKGDRDCKLSCKQSRNQRQTKAATQATPAQEGTPASQAKPGVDDEYYWGYASGVVATRLIEEVEVVLAEMTQTFDQDDKSYFFPLMAEVERRLGRKPRYGALDAAFDAWYVYEYFHSPDHDGFAAVPFVQRGGHPPRRFDEGGLPLCAAGLGMPLKSTFFSRTPMVPHEKGRYVCPLLYPQPTGASCPIQHEKWPQGGCLTTLATSIGARIRYQLDRESAAYKALYKQRTATERVNSQAVELGIERPKLRNYRAIANHNTLLYVLINLRALHRLRARKAEQPAAQAEP